MWKRMTGITMMQRSRGIVEITSTLLSNRYLLIIIIIIKNDKKKKKCVYRYYYFTHCVPIISITIIAYNGVFRICIQSEHKTFSNNDLNRIYNTIAKHILNTFVLSINNIK